MFEGRPVFRALDTWGRVYAARLFRLKTFETLDRYTTPDGQELTFHRRDGDYFVYLDGDELMSSRAPGSERALAEIACGDLSGRPRVLIGGQADKQP